jgi:hypothetical protein
MSDDNEAGRALKIEPAQLFDALMFRAVTS